MGTKGVSRENIEIYQITSLPSSSPAPAHDPNQIIGCMTISTSRIRMTKLQKYRTSVSCVDLHVSRPEIVKVCRERHRHEQCKRTFPWNYNTAYPKHHSCPCRRPTPSLSCTLACSQNPQRCRRRHGILSDTEVEASRTAQCKCTFFKS